MKWLLSLLFLGFTITSRADSPLEVGFASRDVTPKLEKDKPVYMAGFGQNRKATEIHDPLMVRCVVLQHEKKKIALACVDVVGLFNDVALNVRKKLPDFTYVMVSSTHNHEGPDTLGLWGASPFQTGVDPKYLKQIEDATVAAIQEADKGKTSVTAQIAKANAPDLLHDGREPYVLHDEMVLLRFLDVKSKLPVGVMIQWNCHPELLGDKNTKISADHVHATVTELEKSQKCPVAYFTGTVGGLMTALHLEIKNAKGESLKDGTFEKTEEYGKLVAQRAEKALTQAEAVTLTPFEIRSQPLLLPMENKMYQLGWQLGVFNRKGFVWKDDPYQVDAPESKDTEKPMAVRTEIGYLKLGELEVAIIPGEIYPELVLGKVQDPADPAADFPKAEIEPSIYGQLKSKHRMIFGLGNDELGYFIPKRQWDAEAPYCYKRTKSQYGEINSIGPEAAPIICKGFAKLVSGK